MKRFKELFVLFVIAVALVLLAAVPAWAGKGGDPGEESCGIGKATAHAAIASTAAPGASEAGRTPPDECKGRDVF
jgi:hypothetical protein